MLIAAVAVALVAVLLAWHARRKAAAGAEEARCERLARCVGLA
jgi:hypothetical protein